MLKIIVEATLAAIAVYYIVATYLHYRKGVGTQWERLIAAARNSATMLWSKFVLVLSAIVSQLDNLADLLGQPDMKTYIQTLIGNPKIVAVVMAMIAIISMISRARTLK